MRLLHGLRERSLIAMRDQYTSPQLKGATVQLLNIAPSFELFMCMNRRVVIHITCENRRVTGVLVPDNSSGIQSRDPAQFSPCARRMSGVRRPLMTIGRSRSPMWGSVTRLCICPYSQWFSRHHGRKTLFVYTTLPCRQGWIWVWRIVNPWDQSVD